MAARQCWFSDASDDLESGVNVHTLRERGRDGKFKSAFKTTEFNKKNKKSAIYSVNKTKSVFC